MKFYLITNDPDSLTGMHLAGVDGELVSDAAEAEVAIKKALEVPQIGIILISDSLAAKCTDTLDNIKLKCHSPLLVEIPDSDGSSRPIDTIMKKVHEAIGM